MKNWIQVRRWFTCILGGLRPIKKVSVFQVTGLKILDRVGHVFFSEKIYKFMHFERHFALNA